MRQNRLRSFSTSRGLQVDAGSSFVGYGRSAVKGKRACIGLVRDGACRERVYFGDHPSWAILEFCGTVRLGGSDVGLCWPSAGLVEPVIVADAEIYGQLSAVPRYLLHVKTC